MLAQASKAENGKAVVIPPILLLSQNEPLSPLLVVVVIVAEQYPFNILPITAIGRMLLRLKRHILDENHLLLPLPLFHQDLCDCMEAEAVMTSIVPTPSKNFLNF